MIRKILSFDKQGCVSMLKSANTSAKQNVAPVLCFIISGGISSLGATFQLLIAMQGNS